MLKAIKCLYRGCKRPEVEEGPPVATNRPSDAKMWSDPATWENGLPGNDTDITIKGPESLPCCSVLLVLYCHEKICTRIEHPSINHDDDSSLKNEIVPSVVSNPHQCNALKGPSFIFISISHMCNET